jgi:UDP-N-acetylmuramoyl-L-alanyl-D-glutamate--2,6-diaminopimelate ligase
LDNFERLGVTADCSKVLPGMVFVDLSEGRNRKEIYKAFHNGASLIFTAQNIKDPELPVVKVNNVYETMLILLNKHFNSPQNKIKLIAVSGSNDKAVVLDMLNRLLGDSNSSVEKGTELAEHVNSLNSMTIEDMYEHLSKLANSGGYLTPMIVDYKLKYFRFINDFKFDCALITGVDGGGFIDQNYVLSSIRSFISQIPEGKPIIVNNDNDLVLKALEASKNTIVITYGLNKKSAVTATSLDINDQISFNYCLQRSFTTCSGNVLEPFEMPITINLLGNGNVNNALAAITCALYYDVDISHVKDILKTYSGLERRFEISSIKDISILDNYCSTSGDLDNTFDGIQILNYNRLLTLQAINESSDWEEIQGYIKVYNQWNDLLGIKEVVLTGCTDIESDIMPLSIHDIRMIKKELKEHIKIKYIDNLSEAVQYLAEKMKAGDLLVLAGDSTMNSAKKMIIDEIRKPADILH